MNNQRFRNDETKMKRSQDCLTKQGMIKVVFALLLSVGFKGSVAAQGGQGWAQGFPTNSVQEGDTATLYPFTFSYSRFQQVYASTGFVNTGPDGVYVREIGFRLDSLLGFSDQGFITNLQINLSTTTRGPDNLSAIFTENVGSDDLLIYGPTTPFFAVGTIGGSPQAYNVSFLFDRPFLYRPSAGNLLLDIRIHDGSSFGNWFDALPQVGDAVSSVSGGINDTFGTVSTLGLPTFFVGTVVPEPSSYTLFALGTAAFLLIKRKRSR